jgi:hypothetical protein
LSGESGSVVVDSATHRVYGHVVGSDPFGNAYVVTLVRVLEQLREYFNLDAVGLAEPERLRASLHARAEQDTSRTVLTVLPAVTRAAVGIQALVDHYNNAPKYVQELHAQCTRARQQLAGMRDAGAFKPHEAHLLFHNIVEDIDKRLEVLLQKLNLFNLGSDNGAGVIERFRAVMSRQEMMDIRQNILERTAQLQGSLLYIDMYEIPSSLLNTGIRPRRLT